MLLGIISPENGDKQAGTQTQGYIIMIQVSYPTTLLWSICVKVEIYKSYLNL